MPSVLANSPIESSRRREGQRLPGPKMAATEGSPPISSSGQRKPCTHSVGCASQRHAGHCGQLSSCLVAGRGCPTCMGYTSDATFRNAFSRGPPALLDRRADGRSLLDPGLPAPRPGQHLQPIGLARPLPTIAPSQPPPAICSSTDLVACRMYG